MNLVRRNYTLTSPIRDEVYLKFSTQNKNRNKKPHHKDDGASLLNPSQSLQDSKVILCRDKKLIKNIVELVNVRF